MKSIFILGAFVLLIQITHAFNNKKDENENLTHGKKGEVFTMESFKEKIKKYVFFTNTVRQNPRESWIRREPQKKRRRQLILTRKLIKKLISQTSQHCPFLK